MNLVKIVLMNTLIQTEFKNENRFVWDKIYKFFCFLIFLNWLYLYFQIFSNWNKLDDNKELWSLNYQWYLFIERSEILAVLRKLLSEKNCQKKSKFIFKHFQWSISTSKPNFVKCLWNRFLYIGSSNELFLTSRSLNDDGFIRFLTIHNFGSITLSWTGRLFLDSCIRWLQYNWNHVFDVNKG